LSELTNGLLDLTQNERCGYLYECPMDASLRKLKVNHESNPLLNPKKWNKSRGKGVDHRINLKKRKILIEDKNLSGKYSITPTIFDREIISRYTAEDPNHKCEWVLSISIPKFSMRVRRLIRMHKIHVITVGFQVTLDNIIEAERILTYKLKLFFGKFSGVFDLVKFRGLIYQLSSTLMNFGHFLLNLGVGPPKYIAKSAPKGDVGLLEKFKMRCYNGWQNICKERPLP